MNRMTKGKALVGKILPTSLNIAEIGQTGTAADITLTNEQMMSNIINITGAASGGFNVIFNTAYKNFYTVINNSGQTATLKNAAGATVTVADTAVGIIQNDGTNIITLSGLSGTAVTLTGTETLTNKTLTAPVVASFYQDAGKTKLMTTPNTASDTLAAIAATQVFTNKTLDDATCKFGDTADNTKDLFFSLGGATADKTMTIISSHSDDRSLTLPNATDTLMGKATSDVMTNKTFDSAGTGNVAKNVVLAYAGNILRAEMVAGKVLVADKAAVAIKVLSVKLFVNGAFNGGAGTSMVFEDTNGAPVNILTALKAALTDGAKISTEGLAIANVTEGAGMVGALTSGKGIAVAADAAWNAGTSVDIVIQYMYT